MATHTRANCDCEQFVSECNSDLGKRAPRDNYRHADTCAGPVTAGGNEGELRVVRAIAISNTHLIA